jgi:F-type H+-transporting ATPase subunit delta
MLSRTASTLLRRSAARHMSTEAASASTSMTLNFSLPHETLYSGASVASVIIPGVEGEYGVTMNHVPIVSQLKPGVLQILHEDGETEKYFVSGGFALTHPNSVTVRAIQ